MSAAQRERYLELLSDLDAAENDARRLRSLWAIQRVMTLKREVEEAYRQIKPTGRIGNR